MEDIIENYFKLRQEVFEYFGYREDWVAIPLEDTREYYWIIDEDEREFIRYAETLEQLKDEEAGQYYEDEIYTQRFLPKWVYRGEKYTLVCSNPGVDGNKFLRVLDNDKEVKEDEL